MDNRLKTFRLLNNITQEEMARKVNITLRHYINIENRTTTPSVKIALEIAKVLDCEVKDIFIS